MKCSNCGENSSLYMEDMITGEKTPMNVCTACKMWGNFLPLENPVHLNINEIANITIEELKKNLEDLEEKLIMNEEEELNNKIRDFEISKSILLNSINQTDQEIEVAKQRLKRIKFSKKYEIILTGEELNMMHDIFKFYDENKKFIENGEVIFLNKVFNMIECLGLEKNDKD